MSASNFTLLRTTFRYTWTLDDDRGEKSTTCPSYPRLFTLLRYSYLYLNTSTAWTYPKYYAYRSRVSTLLHPVHTVIEQLQQYLYLLIWHVLATASFDIDKTIKVPKTATTFTSLFQLPTPFIPTPYNTVYHLESDQILTGSHI